MKKLLILLMLVGSILTGCGLTAEDLPEEVTIVKKTYNESTVTVTPLMIGKTMTTQTQVHPEEFIAKIENKESEFTYTLYLTKAQYEQLKEGDILTKEEVLALQD